MNNQYLTIDQVEVEKFSKISSEWWDPSGKFRPLHLLNPIRIQFIRDKIIKHFQIKSSDFLPLSNLELLDVGSGGGLICEPMHKLGANVTGIDASELNINIAKIHAKKSDLNITYLHKTIEQMADQSQKYDVLLSLEVVEHVANVELFLSKCSEVLKPGGIMFISTLNRTFKSFLFSIIGAEYILRWLPIGTHDWKKFLLPSEIITYLKANQCDLTDIKGFKFNPLQNKFYLSNDTTVSYIMAFKKN